MHVYGPLTAEADKDLEYTDDGDSYEAGLVVVLQSVHEYPGVNPDELGQHERQYVAVEQELAGVVQTHALDELVAARRQAQFTARHCTLSAFFQCDSLTMTLFCDVYTVYVCI